jgi:type VI secretion system lysozyme-like protein
MNTALDAFTEDSAPPSLLDKLTLIADEPLTPVQRVMMDIEKLFNAKLSEVIDSDFPRVTHSILNYGMPHFYATGHSSDEAASHIEARMVEIIKDFEPRLIEVKITLKKVAKFAIDFEINALLLAKPEPIKIKFDSQYQPSVENFEVKPL